MLREPWKDAHLSNGERVGLAAENGGSVVFITLRIAARNGDRQRFGEGLEEADQIVGVLSGDVDADEEARYAVTAVAPDDEFESSTELFVAVGRFGEGEFVGGGLEIIAQKGGIMAVA